MKQEFAVNTYFIEFLEEVLKTIFHDDFIIFDAQNFSIMPTHQVLNGILEILCKYFEGLELRHEYLSMMELKMRLALMIQSKVLSRLWHILAKPGFICFSDAPLSQGFEEIKAENRTDALRTKTLYHALRLFNCLMRYTYKTEENLFKITAEDLERLPDVLLRCQIGHEIIRLVAEFFFLPYNNLINNRLAYNKSKLFILMEKSYPVEDKDHHAYFTLLHRCVDSDFLATLPKKHVFLCDFIIPAIYKFLVAFLYLNDENKKVEFEATFDTLFAAVNAGCDMKIVATDPPAALLARIQCTNSSYTSFFDFKLKALRHIAAIRRFCEQLDTSEQIPERFSRNLHPFVRSDRFRDGHDLRPTHTLVERGSPIIRHIIEKMVYISSIDDRESIKNMLKYFIEEFENSNANVSYAEFAQRSQSIYLNPAYVQVIRLLTEAFRENRVLKENFIALIIRRDYPESPNEDLFFNKFWLFYRDSIFFSAFNFFHSALWQRIVGNFAVLSDFLIEITRSSGDAPNPILKYFYDFKLKINFSNEHTLFFQQYVILECLGNYCKLLNIRQDLLFENKQELFFIFQKIFKVLSNMLLHPESQLKVYVFRIDIWMNVIINNISDIDSNYYVLKSKLMNYFFSIASGQESQIIKFYGANVHPEIFKFSMNELFSKILNKFKCRDLVLENPFALHEKLRHYTPYKVLSKQFQFYNILLCNDVQLNYLNLFLKENMEKLDKYTLSVEQLEKLGYLFFYFAERVNSKFEYELRGKHLLKKVVSNENRLYPMDVIIDMVKNGKLRLIDYFEHQKQMTVVDERVCNNISFLFDLYVSKKTKTKEEKEIMEKILKNDHDWIKKNIL